jgi:hypothetical protein
LFFLLFGVSRGTPLLIGQALTVPYGLLGRSAPALLQIALDRGRQPLPLFAGKRLSLGFLSLEPRDTGLLPSLLLLRFLSHARLFRRRRLGAPGPPHALRDSLSDLAAPGPEDHDREGHQDDRGDDGDRRSEEKRTRV